MYKKDSVVRLTRNTESFGKNCSELSAGTEYIVLGYTNTRQQFAGTWYRVKSVDSGAEFEFHQDILEQS